jgi:restriction system protein
MYTLPPVIDFSGMMWTIFLNFLSSMLAAWPFWLLLIGFFAVLVLFKIIIPDWIERQINRWRFKKGEGWRSDRELIGWLRGMRPYEFEDYVADLFNRMGYKAQAVGRSHDGGIDVIAEKDGIKHYIQCKKFITKVVGIGAVRDFHGAVADHLTQGTGYFITTNKFTLEAERFTEDKPIELIDGFKLVKYIRSAEKNNQNISSPPCPKCGGNLVERNGKYGNFLGCSNYPKCNFTQKI